MKMPGFTAEIIFSQTDNHYRLAAGGSLLSKKTTVTRRALLAAQSGVVPAQIDSERLFWASRLSGVRRLWEGRPACPIGQSAVWVERPPTKKECTTQRPFFNLSTMRWELRTETYQCGWNPAFTGWECQSVFRVAV